MDAEHDNRLRAAAAYFAFLFAFVVVPTTHGRVPPRRARRPNRIVLENRLPGTTAWLGPEAASPAIEGYTSEVSVAPGDEVHFHVSTRPAAQYRIGLFRLGWYRGLGARALGCLPSCRTSEQGTAQPLPSPPSSDRGVPVRADWPVTDVMHVRRRWLSGYYEARFVLTSGADAVHGAETYFIVRAQQAHESQVLVQVPANTWEAYNTWGGRSLYTPTGSAGYRVSFDRPYAPGPQTPLAWEIQLVRYLERNGYDVSYQTDLDTDRDPSSLMHHRLVMTAGHDEYWTRDGRSSSTDTLSSTRIPIRR